MRKTKIICTLGPSTDKDGVLRELVANGIMLPVLIFPTALTKSIWAALKS